jgi:hypothetical protein
MLIWVADGVGRRFVLARFSPVGLLDAASALTYPMWSKNQATRE